MSENLNNVIETDRPNNQKLTQPNCKIKTTNPWVIEKQVVDNKITARDKGFFFRSVYIHNPRVPLPPLRPNRVVLSHPRPSHVCGPVEAMEFPGGSCLLARLAGGDECHCLSSKLCFLGPCSFYIVSFVEMFMLYASQNEWHGATGWLCYDKYTYIDKYMFIYVYMNVNVYEHVFFCVCVFRCIHKGRYVCMYECLYTYMWARMYVCMYVCVYF